MLKYSQLNSISTLEMSALGYWLSIFEKHNNVICKVKEARFLISYF